MATKGKGLRSTSINGFKQYTLISQRSTVSTLDPKKKRALRKDKVAYLHLQPPCYPMTHLPVSAPHFLEEMKENAQTVIYDHYKFVTKEERERLNLTDLIGSNLLKASMHGYCLEYGLYKKARNLAEPFNPEEILTRKRQQEEEARRQGRITLIKKLPKVNRSLAARLHQKEEEDIYEKENAEDTGAKKKKKNKGLTTDIMKDNRFKLMFENQTKNHKNIYNTILDNPREILHLLLKSTLNLQRMMKMMISLIQVALVHLKLMSLGQKDLNLSVVISLIFFFHSFDKLHLCFTQ